MYYVLIKLCSCFDGVCIITPPMFSVLLMMCTCKHMNVVIRVVSLLLNIKEMWYTCLVFCIPMDFTDIRAFTNNLTSGCNIMWILPCIRQILKSVHHQMLSQTLPTYCGCCCLRQPPKNMELGIMCLYYLKLKIKSAESSLTLSFL